ncbi:MAG TPA: nitrile hydratase subunit beta [Candidatus Binataceae bacterium]
MNGVHDMGGMDGFGPVVHEDDEPVFHAEWEGRVYALVGSALRAIDVNVDEFRHAIERIAPAQYLASSYYERWLSALETLLVERGATGMRARDAVASRAETPRRARFTPGDRVRARNLNPAGHTRMPRYVRGKSGVIRRDWGVFVFPDSNAHHAGTRPQHVYCVEFAARELWGKPANIRERLFIDLCDEYLEPADKLRKTAKPKARNRTR